MPVTHGMAPSELLVLSLLAEKDMYGFEFITALDQQPDNPFQLKEGALYPVLHTLEQKHCVRSYSKDTPAGTRRRYYQLTKSGEKLLKKSQQNGGTL